MFLIRRPSPREVDAFLADCRERPFSYRGPETPERPPAGFLVDRETFPMGQGRQTFARAVEAVRSWRQFDLGWVTLFPVDAPVAPGAAVAVCIRHLGFWSLNGARVVSTSGSARADSFGLTYRTLTNHAECGEESFTVTLNPETGAVSYTIHAISSPHVFLTKLGLPYVRVLQARFRRDSADALRLAINRPAVN